MFQKTTKYIVYLYRHVIEETPLVSARKRDFLPSISILLSVFRFRIAPFRQFFARARHFLGIRPFPEYIHLKCRSQGIS